ncbi:hypothetical protein HNQ69_001476 [Bartonella callosciuri]|uniref:Uncharacterized protein n=1 Tax=Bartonella callosciuri TaxID=686223 RepID=A0A840NV88_9HYPH|nr:hypothetical protein [Bartonella callosciuri]
MAWLWLIMLKGFIIKLKESRSFVLKSILYEKIDICKRACVKEHV